MTADSTADVLALIDGALRDRGTGKDAIRWVPEEKRAAADVPVVRPALSAAGPEGPWHAVGSIADGTMTLADGTTLRVREPAVVPYPPEVPGELVELGRRLGEVCGELLRALSPVIEGAARQFHDLDRAFFPYRHGRCWTCHPHRRPKPLAVDGREYQRRLRHRRRRLKRRR